MTINEIQIRIADLVSLELAKSEVSAQKRIELATKEAEAAEIKKQINLNIFANSPEAIELQELRTTAKWIES